LVSEGEKESAILKAVGQKESQIRLAEGEAEAILKVQQAPAVGLKRLKDAGADRAVLTLKSFEALAKVADGKATKLIIPSDLQALGGLAGTIKEIIKD
jgi:regulator of protease activity HflC (stomatin/prohibitin superfamily)